MHTEKFEFVRDPETTSPPDNVFSDGQGVSWNAKAKRPAIQGDPKEYDARYGHMQPEFEGEFPIPEGGEYIEMLDPSDGAALTVDVLNDDGEIERTTVLQEQGDNIFIPGGKDIRVSTGKVAVQYLCAYPGKPVED